MHRWTMVCIYLTFRAWEKMVSNRFFFFFNLTSLHQIPSTSVWFVGYIENLSEDEPNATYNYQTNGLMTDAGLSVAPDIRVQVPLSLRHL